MSGTITEKQPTKRNILKATLVLGSSSVAQVGMTIIRTKILAMLLGPAGIGLAGLLNNIIVTATSLFNLGFDTSANRHIAQANSNGDIKATGKARTAIMIFSVCLGLLGALASILLSEPLAKMLLGNTTQAFLIQIVSVGIFFTIIHGIESATLAGFRRYGDSARGSIISNVVGTVVACSIAWFYRDQGVVYYVIAVPFINLLVLLFYLAKIKAPLVSVNLQELKLTLKPLVKLGIPVMFSALVVNALMLAVRGRIANTMGLEAVGLFQVAWAISGIYVGFVLKTFSSEFFPRLTALADDSGKINETVNQQIIMVVWLTTPLLLGISAFSSIVVQVLYSSEFFGVIKTLRWMALGTVLKVVTTTISYIWLSKGRGKFVFTNTILWGSLFSIPIVLWLEYTGLAGVGWFYTASYVFSLIYARRSAGHITGFKFELNTMIEVSFLFFSCLAVIIINEYFLEDYAIVLSTLLFGLLTLRSLIRLYSNYR